MGYLRLGSALALSLTTVVACGSDDEGLTSAQFAAEYCALYRPCCQEAGLPVTQQGCNFLFGFMPINDPAAAQQCLDEWKARAQSPDFCKLENDANPESCQRAFPQGMGTSQPNGTAPPGASCEFDSDCAPSSRGEVSCTFGSGQSICQVQVAAKEGEACAGTRDGTLTVFTPDATATEIGICSRQEGLYCSDGACKAGLGIGSACQTSVECGNGRCNQGVCEARVPQGAACTDSDECVTNYCNSDSKCGTPSLGGLGLALFCA